jgi:hypothetical protein
LAQFYTADATPNDEEHRTLKIATPAGREVGLTDST